MTLGEKKVSAKEKLAIFARYAGEGACVLRSLKVALFVGTVLALINHYDAILSGSLGTVGILQVLVTYVVPYSVATFGSASHGLQMELDNRTRSVLLIGSRDRF